MQKTSIFILYLLQYVWDKTMKIFLCDNCKEIADHQRTMNDGIILFLCDECKSEFDQGSRAGIDELF